MDFTANIRETSCFHPLSLAYAVWQILVSMRQFYAEMTSQVLLLILCGSWIMRDASCFLSPSFMYVQVLHVRQILTAIRLKVWTSSGTSHWFYPQQDLHFSTEAGFEQRVWLLSLLVKCLKKTCNLNWCRAHQYEIGWMGGGGGGWGLRRQPSTRYAQIQQHSLFPGQQLRVGLNLWSVFHCC